MQERVFHELVHFHDGCFVTATVAVVGCGEDGDDVAVVGPVVTVHHKLMGACYQFQVIRVVELLRYVLAEGVAGSTGGDTPSASVIWVGPEQIADRSLMWHLHDPVKLLDLVEGVDTGREATVQAEDAALDDSCEGQVVKERGEVLPHVGITILTEALIVESIDLRDLLAFVVAAQDGDTLWIANLVADEECHCLDGVVAAVYVVAHEEVVVVGQLTSNLEKFLEIIELSMDVTADRDRCRNFGHVAFFL